MEGLIWFKHRFNLSRDSRLYKLIDEEGARGYGSYLYIIEQLYSQESPRLFLGQLKLIQQKGFPQAYLEKIVRNYGLFVIEGDMFSSAIDYFGTSRKSRGMSKKNTAGRSMEEEDWPMDRETVDEEVRLMTEEAESVAEEVSPMTEKARPLVEENEDSRAAASPADTVAEMTESCAAAPCEPAANCLPTPSRLPAGSQSTSNPESTRNDFNRLNFTDLWQIFFLARVREEKRIEEENRKYLPHISPSFEVEEVEEQSAVFMDSG